MDTTYVHTIIRKGGGEEECKVRTVLYTVQDDVVHLVYTDVRTIIMPCFDWLGMHGSGLPRLHFLTARLAFLADACRL